MAIFNRQKKATALVRDGKDRSRVGAWHFEMAYHLTTTRSWDFFAILENSFYLKKIFVRILSEIEILL